MGGHQSVCVVVLGEGGGGESLFILFLVSGVPELREGEASDRDPPRLSASPRRRLHSLREERKPRSPLGSTAERRAPGAGAAQRVLAFCTECNQD